MRSLFRKKFQLTLLLVFYVLSTSASALTDTVQLTGKTDVVSLGTRATFLEDESAKLTISQIQTPAIQSRFQSNNDDIFSRRASPSVIWAKIVLANKSGLDVWLNAGGSYSCWYIDFYRPDAFGKYGKAIETGSMRPAKNKQYPVNFYWLPLAAGNQTDVRTYYVRFAGSMAKQYPLKAGTLTALTKDTELNDTVITIFVGWMLAMILYHFMLGITIKDRIYFIYTACLCFSLINTTYLGSYTVFTGNWFRNYHFVWFTVNFCFSFYFAKEYLQLSKNAPHLNKIIWALTAACCSFAVLNIAGVPIVYLTNAFQFTVAAGGLLLLYPAVHLWRRGLRQGKIYTLGWSVTMLSIILFVILLQGNILPHNIYTRNFILMAVALQALIFSMALADRLNTMRNEKEAVQAENLRLVNDQKYLLEQKVQARTAELEQQKQQIEMQAENLKQVNATKDKLLSIVGHDLRGAIGNLRDLLMMDDIDTINAADFMALKPLLQQNVSNLYEALDNLLLWSYSQMNGLKSKPESLQLDTIAAQTTTLLAGIANKKQITIINAISPDVTIYADQNQVNVLLRNLVSNALKFTPNGGAITITASKQKGKTMISVADTGVGMNNEQLEKIFRENDHFSTYGTNGESGTGLGLLLCKEMAELNKGDITVASEPNKGTIFTVTLPGAPEGIPVELPQQKEASF